jgi:transposase
MRTPKEITDCRRFFLEPQSSRQRQYEALRAYYIDNRPPEEVARAFGYTRGSFHVLCHRFRHAEDPRFFTELPRGPRSRPKKSAARSQIIALRKQNHSVYEISEALKEQNLPLSPTAVREVLREEGFAALPRRLDEERPLRVRPTVEPVADARSFSLTPRSFTTACGGLFLFVPGWIRLGIDQLAAAARLPGSKMIPAEHALRSALALKLWSIERKSHIMALVADEGLALFAGLNAIPKKSYLSEYSCRIDHKKTVDLLAAWHQQVLGENLFGGDSFNLDFHAVPYFGDHPVVERHYVPSRSQRRKSILVFLAQDVQGRAFCYSNSDLRKGEEAEEIFRFIDFWKRIRKDKPRHLVFDSRLTTYTNLGRLDEMGIQFITLRRRSPKLLQEVYSLPRSAWRTVELDVPTRTYRTPRVYEQKVDLVGRIFRQLFIMDLGHEEPTILLTNEQGTTAKKLITRYAQRMLIENALSDAVRFFHMDALSSAVGLKTDFDMSLLVVASGLYRLLADRMTGYRDAQARQIFRDIVDMPADVSVTDKEITVAFHRRAHLPIIIGSGLFEEPVRVPWWNNLPLRLTT